MENTGIVNDIVNEIVTCGRVFRVVIVKTYRNLVAGTVVFHNTTLSTDNTDTVSLNYVDVGPGRCRP